MNKKINLSTLLVFLIPFVSFAQRASRGEAETGGGYKEQGGPIVPGHTPIDQYEIALIIMAVSIIAYFVYRQYTAKKQA